MKCQMERHEVASGEACKGRTYVLCLDLNHTG